VPFETGVPVLRANPKPSEEFGCEVVMVPKAEYNIDFEFWGRMMPALSSKSALERKITLHHHRYSVHNNDIMHQMGYSSMASFSAATGICQPIESLSDIRYKDLNTDPNFPVPYVCDFISKGVMDPRGIEANIDLVDNQYNSFVNFRLALIIRQNMVVMVMLLVQKLSMLIRRLKIYLQDPV
jgi:hypothetical protein